MVSRRFPTFVLLVVLCMAGCSRVAPVPRGNGAVVSTMGMKGVSGLRLYELSRAWLAGNLRSEKNIFDYENPVEGTLVANGVVDYPATGLEAIRKIQYSISFRLRVKTAPGTITLSFENFLIAVPKVYTPRAVIFFGREYSGGYSRPPQDDEEYAAIRKAVSEITGKFRLFMEDQTRKLPETGVQDRGKEAGERVPSGTD